MTELFFQLLAVIGIILSGILYIVPTLIGWRRQDSNLLSLFVVNLFLGFTFIGWVIALAYAVRSIPLPFFHVQLSKE